MIRNKYNINKTLTFNSIQFAPLKYRNVSHSSSSLFILVFFHFQSLFLHFLLFSIQVLELPLMLSIGFLAPVSRVFLIAFFLVFFRSQFVGKSRCHQLYSPFLPYWSVNRRDIGIFFGKDCSLWRCCFVKVHLLFTLAIYFQLCQ